MSVSDTLMWRYIELLSFASLETIHNWKQEVEKGRNPREIKVLFAQEIVTRFHSKTDAEKALIDFEARFKKGILPDDIPEKLLAIDEANIPIAQLLKQAGLTSSTSEALRMIEQGGVKLNGNKIVDKTLHLAAGETVIVQVGKRKFSKVMITSTKSPI